MKPRFLLQFLGILVALFFSGRLDAQVVPKKIVFLSSVGSGPPPVTSSSIFKTPFGVAISATASPGSISGTIYVADPLNNQVVAFPPGGSSTTFGSLPCPNTVHGCVQNPWPLNNPTAVAGAPNGNVWISDTGNDVVVEINSSGTVVAFAGQGPSNVVCGGGCSLHPNSGQGNGQFFGPGPLAVDSAGNVYVADAAGDVFLGEATSGAFGLACASNPAGAANCPQASNFRIEKFTSGGTYVTSLGSFCSFSSTTGVIVDTNGDVIGGTAGNTCNTSAPGAIASGDGQFAYITGIAVDDASNLYVSDADNNRIQKFRSDATFFLKWGGLPTGNGHGQFNGTGGIAVDLDQTVYVIDVFNNRVEEFDTSGNFVATGGSNGSAEAHFNGPIGIATVPPAAALVCLFGGVTLFDCTHGFIVSEQGTNKRVQFLAGRPDTDNDGITDEVDAVPGVFSNNFSDVGLGFTTTGSVVNAGDQTFVIYNTLSPSPADEIRIRTESFGGPTPLSVTLCGAPVTISFPAGTGANVHCSTPTVTAEFGPVGVKFVGSDGTISTGNLGTGASLSIDVSSSKITGNAGTIALVVGGHPVTLAPGQSVFSLTPNFSLSPVLAISILDGGSAAPLIGVNSVSGFSSPVGLTVSGAPAGVSASLSPNLVTLLSGGSAFSTLTVNVGPSVPPGAFTLTVTGTSGSLTHSITVSVTVVAPKYSMGAKAVGPITTDASGNYVAGVKLTNNGNVTLSSLSILKATLNTAAATSLPGTISNLTPGASAVVTLAFPSSAGAAGKTVALKITGAYEGELADGVTQPGGFTVALFEVLP